MSRLFYLLFLCYLSPCLAQEALRLPVIQIVIDDEVLGKQTGTAFHVGDSAGSMYFLTASHVIEESPDNIRITFRNGQKAIGKRVAENTEIDVALISCPQPANFRISPSYTASSQPPTARQKVIIVGNPEGENWDINARSEVKEVDINFDARFFTLVPDGITGGSSGSPVLSSDHHLLGMVIETNFVRAVAVAWPILRRLLTSWNAPTNRLTFPAQKSNLAEGSETFISQPPAFKKHKIKRENFVNFSLNSYLGATNGIEIASNSDTTRMGYHVGLTGSIGLAFSFGYKSLVRPFDEKDWLRPLTAWQQADLELNQNMPPVLAKRSGRYIEQDDNPVYTHVIHHDSTFYEGLLKIEEQDTLLHSAGSSILSTHDTTFYFSENKRFVKWKRRMSSSRNFFHRGRQYFLNGASGSIYLSIFDIGTITQMRFDSSSESSLFPSPARFAHFFAPGIFFIHGLRDLPLSIMMGVQFSPDLRTFNQITNHSLRFSSGIALDFPVINFYTR